MNNQEIIDLIERRRRQIIVHSYLYYERDNSLVTDKKYDEWAYELYDLQKQYPKIASECFMAEDFKEYHPSSGFYFDYSQEWIARVADRLIRIDIKKRFRKGENKNGDND